MPHAECKFNPHVSQTDILPTVVPQLLSASLSNHYTVRALAQLMIWRLSQELTGMSEIQP